MGSMTSEHIRGRTVFALLVWDVTSPILSTDKEWMLNDVELHQISGKKA